jgi:uncharacterized membrane-anchored protein YhcB (DUF1043 family)
MNYISQTIVFALALMGILFKGTKTDTEGNTVYTTSGLPALTATGRVVIILLSISFGISLVTIWQKNKSEEAARKAQEELKAYNQGIDDTLKKVFATSSELSETQKKSFQDVLTEQKTTGTQIASGIDTSAELLRGRIESSSTLLSGRIGKSISLLNHSANAIAGLTDPIGTIGVNLLIIEVPLTDPALEKYRARVEPVLKKALVSGKYESHFGIGDPFETSGIPICSNSPLLPKRTEERAAYNLLTRVRLDVCLNKCPLGDEQLMESGCDLILHVRRQLKFSTLRNDCVTDDNFSVLYDVNKHRVFLVVQDLSFDRPPLAGGYKASPPNDLQPYEHWSRPAGGKLVGVLDLAGAQISLRIGNPYGTEGILGFLDFTGINSGDLDGLVKTTERVQQQSKMALLWMNLSRESLAFQGQDSDYYFNLSPDSDYVYRSRMRRTTNKSGFTYYVDKLP